MASRETAPEMIFIRGGTFRMGSDKHRCTVSPSITNRYERTSPVTAFPPNSYGLYDMIGNVWEWTSDWWPAQHEADAFKACCKAENPRGGPEAASYDPCLLQIKIPRESSKVARIYARRITAAVTADLRATPRINTSTSHVEFRCAIRGGSKP